MKKCSVEGCDKPHSARGYCKNHYRQHIYYKDTRKKCIVEGCDQPYYAKELCKNHWKKQYRKREDVQKKESDYSKIRRMRRERRVKINLKGKAINSPWSDFYNQAKRQAKLREIPWDINMNQYKEITLNPCHYCGQSLCFETGVCLDRINNYKGYCLNNVLPACSVCNKIRGEYLSVEEAKLAISAIKSYRNNNKEIITTKTGCLLIPIIIFYDGRGSFSELWRTSWSGLPSFKQENESISKGNVIRGIHFQKNKPQGKFVRVLHGAVTDVVIDLNPESKTFGILEHFLLLPDTYSLYIPPTHGHGFWAHKHTTFLYKCTEEYVPEFDAGINPLDKDMPYPWFFGNPKTKYIVSEKDKNLPNFKDWKLQLDFNK